MSRCFGFLLVASLFASPLDAKTITLATAPSGASIFHVTGTGRPVLLGVGTAKLKLDSAGSNEVVVVLDGYEPVRRNFPRSGSYSDRVLITLLNRLIKVSVTPADAELVRDGVVIGAGSADIIVPQGQSVSVTARKVGFAARTVTYSNSEKDAPPPVSDRIELADKVVLVTAVPAGTTILADNKVVGETSVDVVIPSGRCVTVKLARRGYAEIEKTYCNKLQAKEPPLQEDLELRDRMVAVRTVPTTAMIEVNGHQAGTGEFQVVVPEGECVPVSVSAEGFVTRRKQYCNQPNTQPPPAEESFQLPVDDAHTNSVKSDVVGTTFTLEPNASLPKDKVWLILNTVVGATMEDIETKDKETGYLRTAWRLTSYPNCSVRTRVIITLTDISVSKFLVKVISEYSPEGGVPVRCDECFKPWDRVLKIYADMVSELKARLPQ